MPFPLPLLTKRIFQRYYPVHEDSMPTPSTADVVGYLSRFGLMPDTSEQEMRQLLTDHSIQLETVNPNAKPAITDTPVRVPAQWEKMERIIVSWPVHFPPLWNSHAQMVEAISPAAEVQINVNHPMWGRAVDLYLQARGKAKRDQITYYHLSTNDIWIRDYGPIVGYDQSGQRIAVAMTYDPLPNFPQGEDNRMPERWAAHEGMPLLPLDFHGEGGNFVSDGQGTILMTNQAYRQNEDLNRDSLLRLMHTAFEFEKLILTPRIRIEETGHIDLVVRLINKDTVLLSAPGALFTNDRLHAVRRQFERETNGSGQRYNSIPLPTPSLYFNWFGYPVRRSYTNSLIVNGRVLVPVYGIGLDDEAIATYCETMPGYEVIPIDCSICVNGGGAVHCVTKEVPASIPA